MKSINKLTLIEILVCQTFALVLITFIALFVIEFCEILLHINSMFYLNLLR